MWLKTRISDIDLSFALSLGIVNKLLMLPANINNRQLKSRSIQK